MLQTFLIALGVVSIMLLYACPGFILIKMKIISKDNISAFAKLLMFVCSPCLVFNSLTRNEYSPSLVKEMAIAFAFIFSAFLIGLLVFRLVFKKKSDNVKYRVYNLATTLANCAFMGVPVLEALFPDYPQAIAFSAMASMALNILGWSVASYIISQDKKYIGVRKIILNPATIAFVIAIPFFVYGVQLPTLLNDMIVLLAKMTTPLCMLIMGMRLACASFKKVFFVPSQYLIIAIKQVLFPLVSLAILLLLPIDSRMRASIYILMACPVASVCLSFAEMIGEGQEEASSLVLLGTLLSAITIPVMTLLI
ncbi:MAG: AEC family transporter [Clostridia bacterium]|nr:AEC family transporter [Clostridia bacterium]